MAKAKAKMKLAALLRAAKLGDTFETEGPLQGLSSEPLIWRVTQVNPTTGMRELKATYMGVFFACIVVDQKGVQLS